MTKRVDQLNIVLLLLSAFLAYQFPLELFIFAFAILGPLHYMTEINWLNTKSYYFTQNNKVWLLIGVVSSVMIVAPKLFIEYLDQESALREVMIAVNSWSNGFIFATLVLAIGYQFIKRTIGWVLLGMIILAGAIFLNNLDQYTTFIGLFVPTIIHVYLFTILFMLYGAKKAKSSWGYLAVALLVLLPFAFVQINLEQHSYLFPDSLKSIYLANNFHVTPVYFAREIGISDGKTFFFYETMELRLMMFIAFIYVYHYLNWFSKTTTTINWSKSLTKKRTLAIVVIWMGLLITFYLNFRLGFLLSLFLSILHVILEFPLNMHCFKEMFKKS